MIRTQTHDDDSPSQGAVEPETTQEMPSQHGLLAEQP
jgi:hypothetical protein